MLVAYFVNFRQLNDHLIGKELFIRFTASAFGKLRSIYVFSYFPFGFEGRMWDLIVSVPDLCFSFYFSHGVAHIYIEPICMRKSSLGSVEPVYFLGSLANMHINVHVLYAACKSFASHVILKGNIFT